MKRIVRVILLDDAELVYQRLEKSVKSGKANSKEIQLFNSIEIKKNFIKADPFYGDNIPKKKIPKTYNVQNLWRVELTDYHRLLYTIKGDHIEIFCFGIDILDHKKYNKKFGYRKR